MTHRADDAPDLNLIPIMNLVTLLIPFLLLSAQFVSYAVIDTTLPAFCSAPCAQEVHDPKPLSLTLSISRRGYELNAANSAVESVLGGLEIPCRTPSCDGPPDQAWDTAGLRQVLVELKSLHPDEQHTTVIPTADVPYEALIIAMDTLREDPNGAGDGSCNGQCLFPLVTIASGVASR